MTDPLKKNEKNGWVIKAPPNILELLVIEYIFVVFVIRPKALVRTFPKLL